MGRKLNKARRESMQTARKIRCSAPLRICIKQVKEAAQNLENPCCFANCSKTESDVPLCFGFALARCGSQTKPGAVGKKLHKTRRIHANCFCTKVRMKSDVPLCFGFTLRELWKPNKTRSCRKEAAQN